MRTKHKCLIFAILALGILFIGVFCGKITPFDPYEQDLSNALIAPCQKHILGTDRYGRDVLSRVLMGTRYSVFSSLALVGMIAAIGTIVGIVCGYVGGMTDSIIMRISDIFLAFPGMVFAIAVAGVLGGGILNAVIALAAISWPKYARLVRSQVLSIKNSTFIEAAKLGGCGTVKMIGRHILPNVAGTILITAVLDIGTMIMEIAGLSFLGLGAMPPTAEWGSMMSNGRSMIQTAPWVILGPGCAIFITVMIFNLLGDSVRDLLDPKHSKYK